MFRQRYRRITQGTTVLTVLALLLLAGPAPADEPARSEGAATDAGHSEPASGLAPDENAVDADGRSPEGGFSYYSVAGTTFRARESTTGWDYASTGCASSVGGTAGSNNLILNTELQLPDGSVIKYLRLYYNDTSAGSDVAAYLSRYEPGVATSDLTSVASSGSTGYGTILSAEITEVVDNFAYSYVLIGWPDISSSQVQVCGLRVAYFAP